MQSISVRLIGKPGCHLCDEAEVIISGVAGRFSNVEIERRNLSDDSQWTAAYAEKIPVIHIDGDEFAYWRVSDEELVEALVSRGGLFHATDSE